jgi:acyl carrier protein
MTEVTAPTRRDEVVSAIGTALGAVLDSELPEVTETTNLFEIGVDSTSVLELLLQLEEDLDWEFDAENLRMEHVETVGALADFVSSTLDA